MGSLTLLATCQLDPGLQELAAAPPQLHQMTLPQHAPGSTACTRTHAHIPALMYAAHPISQCSGCDCPTLSVLPPMLSLVIHPPLS